MDERESARITGNPGLRPAGFRSEDVCGERRQEIWLYPAGQDQAVTVPDRLRATGAQAWRDWRRGLWLLGRHHAVPGYRQLDPAGRLRLNLRAWRRLAGMPGFRLGLVVMLALSVLVRVLRWRTGLAGPWGDALQWLPPLLVLPLLAVWRRRVLRALLRCPGGHARGSGQRRDRVL